MLTHREHGDVPHDDQLGRPHIELLVENLGRVHVDAGKDLGE